MNRFVLAALVASGAAQTAAAETISAMELLDLLRSADGSVRVLMSGDVDMNLLEGVLVSLADAPADAVRFGVAGSVPNRADVVARIQSADIAAWAMCDLWLRDDDGFTAQLAEIGGSLILMDNGENDEDRYHPSQDDPNLGREENPMVFGFLDAVTDWGLITDPVEYEVSWNSFVYNFPLNVNDGGCQ